MTEYTTEDEFEAIDAEFERCWLKVTICIMEGSPITNEVDEAADRMLDIAIYELGDPSMLAFCMSLFDGFLEHGRIPPLPMIEHMNEAFKRYRSPEGTTLDAAFGLKRTMKGQPTRWSKRAPARTRSRVVEYLSNELKSDSKAIGLAKQMFGEKGIERDYRKYRRIVKSK